MAAPPLLQQRAAKAALPKTLRNSQVLSQTDGHKYQQHIQIAQLLQSPSPAAPKIKYKSPEDYFDEVNELKQVNGKLKEENAYLLGRVRSLEKQLHSEDRLLNANVKTTHKVVTSSSVNFDTVSHQATTGDSPRITSQPPKGTDASSANTVHMVALKKQLVSFKAELAAAKQRCTTLENDIKRSNLDQWRIEKESYYQEVQRLQGVIREKDEVERLRLESGSIRKESAAQTDELSLNAYSDLALKQLLSQRDKLTPAPAPAPAPAPVTAPQPINVINSELKPRSPNTPKNPDYQLQQVSRLKALLCTIMTQAQKIRGLEHENRMLRVRIQVEEDEARKSITEFVSGRLERMKAELESREADIEFVSYEDQPNDDIDAAFDAERQDGKRLGQEWIAKELLVRGDRILELEAQIRELRMQVSILETTVTNLQGSEAAEKLGETIQSSYIEEPEKPFEDLEPLTPVSPTPVTELNAVEVPVSARSTTSVAPELPTEIIILPQPVPLHPPPELQPESARSLSDESVNELADLLRGYVVCKNKNSRNATTMERNEVQTTVSGSGSGSGSTAAPVAAQQPELEPDEIDMLVSSFLAHQSNKQKLVEMQSAGDTDDSYDQIRAALLAHSTRKEMLRGAKQRTSAQPSLDDDELQMLMSSLTAHQVRQRRLQQMQFLTGARTKQFTKA